MEGTEENPFARAEFDWLRLRDPATNRIPSGIANKELAFANRLSKESDLQALTAANDWVSRGPYQLGGRTKALAIDVTNEDHILAASTSSGMFKSTDGGNSWVKTTAPNQLHSATSIAQNQAPGREHIWYYGTGDRAPYGMSSSADGLYLAHHRGDGIFKSSDGGETWTQLASTASNSPNQTDAFDFVYGIETFGEDGVIAATATGIYRSTDGGQTWTNPISLVDPERSPALEIAKGSDGMLYASLAGDGGGNGVSRSTDGIQWESFTPPDWPESTVRTVIAPVPSNPNAVYFFVEVGSLEQQLRKYVEGSGWSDLTSGLPFNAQMATFGGNLMELSVKPDDENTVFLGAIDLFRSTDGGQSFDLISGYGPNFHVDQTAIVFYPSNPKRMLVGNDGGVYRVQDNTVATVSDNLPWQSLNNGYLTTQFYTVAIDHGTPGSELVIGGTQDHGTVFTASSDPSEPWQILRGGDGAHVAIADGGDYMVFANGATFKVWRWMGQQVTEITPTGVPAGLWLTLFQLDPHDQKIMYLPSQRALWRNSDLTGIPQQDGGGTTGVNWESLENVTDHYITALGMSEAAPRRLYYSGFDANQGARVFYLDNPHEGQPEPVDITSEDFPFYPYSPWVGRIAVDPRDSNKLIVVFPSYGVISLYASDNAGSDWTPVGGNLEENLDGTGSGPSVRWLSILYVDDQPVYLAATSVGLFSTTDLNGSSTKWVQEAPSTIGNVVIDMIDVRQSDGFTAVATHGNGVYTTYITTVPTSTEGEFEQPIAFEISSAYPNPFCNSTAIQYDLPRAGVVSASVYDVRGRKIETLFAGTQQAGRNQLRWDGANAADGVYFVRVDFGDVSRSEKVVLQR
ncbi:MAG TPA: T9SS type A sorting domain-containing protein [Rhodothermales bacterium]|nr:T9SS type A sorting domain-containing protein [Rhodothermales bacterium]